MEKPPEEIVATSRTHRESKLLRLFSASRFLHHEGDRSVRHDARPPSTTPAASTAVRPSSRRPRARLSPCARTDAHGDHVVQLAFELGCRSEARPRASPGIRKTADVVPHRHSCSNSRMRAGTRRTLHGPRLTLTVAAVPVGGCARSARGRSDAPAAVGTLKRHNFDGSRRARRLAPCAMPSAIRARRLEEPWRLPRCRRRSRVRRPPALRPRRGRRAGRSTVAAASAGCERAAEPCGRGTRRRCRRRGSRRLDRVPELALRMTLHAATARTDELHGVVAVAPSARPRGRPPGACGPAADHRHGRRRGTGLRVEDTGSFRAFCRRIAFHFIRQGISELDLDVDAGREIKAHEGVDCLSGSASGCRSRLCVRISKCSRLSLSLNGRADHHVHVLLVGSGTGPVMVAPVRSAVLHDRRADLSTCVWSYPLSGCGSSAVARGSLSCPRSASPSYLTISVTTPAPTVRPPSRIAKRSPPPSRSARSARSPSGCCRPA